jgi:hypothetical protein
MDRMRAFGGGDYRNSPQYAEYLSTTGRSVKNPYGSSGVSGILGKIFGEENISSTLDPVQAQKVLDVGFDRYMNFDQQSDLARSRGFGSLFSGAVGEQLANNQTVAEQVTPMSTSEMGARLGASAVGLGPVLSLLPSTAGPNSNVNFISTGNPNYKEALDPNVNSDLSSGIMGNIGKILAGGVDLQEAGGRVMDRGSQGLASLTERFGANDLEVPAGVMGNLERPMDKYAGQGPRDLLAAQITPAGLTADYDTIAAGSPPNVSMTATSALELPSAMEQGPPQLVLGKPLESEILGGFEANDFLDYPGLDRDTRFRTTLTGSGAYTPTLQELMESRLRNAKRAQQ